ncbi:MAG: L-aspartate oxidase [Lachnospiraceae bacterium]|nr:L-aspartate oxidase [Lachnospiraceae bacterium]MDD6193164.1 L-aspartate oxidase [Lachnospiraceae bacterium]MDY4793179.1 L-aspartate oxidase [Pararoseburia sp.]
METDYLIAGCGCSGLFCALHLPKDKQVLVITKSDSESNDSFLAQGGMCTLTCEEDYDSFFEDTLKAGHYENDKKSVDIMIRTSQSIVEELTGFGVDFQRDGYGNLVYTREGAHSRNRIVFHEDVTGKEITSHLLAEAKKRDNITIMEYVTLLDVIEQDNVCYGAVVKMKDGTIEKIAARQVVLATGGVGGAYKHSTNFKHLTGDGVAIAVKHGMKLRDINYVQIHPTTLYTKEPTERSFLISESVRGEGAKLYDKNGNRFVNELLPRDLLTKAILEQMEKDGTEFVWEDLRSIPREELYHHFPNIMQHCKEVGYDVTKECIPVVPAQHYFMGGIYVNYESKTSMDRLYAVGETACNGVHGKNRLASNSLLESLVFAKRAAQDISEQQDTEINSVVVDHYSSEEYQDITKVEQDYREKVAKVVKGE